MTVREYMEKCFNEYIGDKNYRVIPKIVCLDGFSISVQGGTRTHYCEPRWLCNEYYEVECGYPSEKEESLMPYCESQNSPTDSVYGYVPIEIVEEIVKKHGGIKL